jgi:hypothetical protein
MSGLPGILMSANGTSPPTQVAVFQIATWMAAPKYAIGLILTFSDDGNLTATVEVTGWPNPFDPAALWVPHDVLKNCTSSQNSNLGFPCTGVRVVVVNYDSGEINLGIARWP